jgi:curved DNA-binding protein CbpA
MGNNSSNRQYTYHQYYNAIKTDKSFDFSKINYSLLNPYEVLEVSKTFTWDELKEAYKHTALLTHPDKVGGNKIVFNFVTECFKVLAEEYKARNANKTFMELKQQVKSYYSKDNEEDIIPAPITGDNFNEKFNKTFDMCKLEDEENDFGYGDIMNESSKIREDFSQENLFEKKKFDNNSFNKIFTKHTPPPPKELVKYKEPEPMVLAKTMNYTEIGGKRPDDYSSSAEKSGKNNLIYSDYKVAYSNTRLVDDEMINKSLKDFKSIEEYEKYRNSKIKKGLTDKEKLYFENKKIKEEQEEYLRLERIKQNDIKIKMNNEKASRLFLK